MTIVQIKFQFEKEKVRLFLDKYGDLPLPPYTKNISNRYLDEKYYQTVFAKNAGAVACPTAGLHFNKEIIKELKKRKLCS